MGKRSSTIITESLTELQKLLPEQHTLNNSKRLESLISLKTHQFATLELLALHLEINPSTLDNWLSIYRAKGIEELLKKKTRNSSSNIITSQIHKGLEQRLSDPQNSFNGFWDARRWVKQTYGGDVEYQLLCHYMTHKLDARIKMPSRSKIKKDQEATEAFIKTP